jgi:flagellar basal-body rod protein FlgF
MTDILQIASIGMLEGKQRLELISRNAASAALPGFRRHVVGVRSFAASLTQTQPSGGPSLGAGEFAVESPLVDSSGAESLGVRVDLHAGAELHTGRALDVAIAPEDLFFALTDGTQTWLTRAGSFQVGPEGVLLGEGGLRVVGTQGDIRVPDADISIGADGRISHAGQIVGGLQLFRANEPGSLQAAAGALLAAPAGMQAAEPEAVRLRTGTLEAANTDSLHEMLDLMMVSRQFEGLSRVVQSYDEALGRTLQQLGEI